MFIHQEPFVRPDSEVVYFLFERDAFATNLNVVAVACVQIIECGSLVNMMRSVLSTLHLRAHFL